MAATSSHSAEIEDTLDRGATQRLERRLDQLDRRSIRLYWVIAAVGLVALASWMRPSATVPSLPVVSTDSSEPTTPRSLLDRAPLVSSPAKNVESALDVYQHADGTWSWRHTKAGRTQDSANRFETYSDAVNDALRGGFVGGTITTTLKGDPAQRETN